MKNTKPFSRRRFLRDGAAWLAAGAAVPTFIPSGVLASEGRPGANERIGVGYIAAGRRAGQVGLTGDGRTVAVADVNLPRAKKFAQGKCPAYQDYRKMLEAKDVDAVVVASPDHWHALHSIHACQAGKDVYVEKPMTLTIREGRLMVDAARKYQRIVQVGSQQRSMAANRAGCEAIRSGRLGKIHTVIGHNYPSPWECRFPAQPVPSGLDWDMWCGPTELVPFNYDIYKSRANPGWISFRPYSGGEMTGWGAHGLDQIQWALGMDASGPTEVWTEGPPFDPPSYTKPESRDRGEKICRVPKVCYRYPGGITVKLDNSNPGGAIFIGDEGKIEIFRGRVTYSPERLAEAPPGEETCRLSKSDHHVQNWLDCIKSRSLPVADVEIGHRSSTVCHLGNIARWVGRRLRWDSVKEVFLDDEEANTYLDRRRREPYTLPEPSSI